MGELNRLTVKTITAAKQAGLYCDGGGPYLQIASSGSKTWIFRYRSPHTGKLQDMGLGPLHAVGLPEAGKKATAQRAALMSGLDPIEAQAEEARREASEAAKCRRAIQRCRAGHGRGSVHARFD